MKTAIVVPAIAGILGMVAPRLFGVTDGFAAFGIGVGSMVLIGGGILILMKRNGGVEYEIQIN